MILGNLTPRALRHRRRKRAEELGYWRDRVRSEGRLGNWHYESLFTTLFGIPRDWYAAKRMLDIGCGPRGSLEWAHEAAERVGLDPLARAYSSLGTDEHEMTYVRGRAEEIAFGSGHFDVVSLFNALDHVDDVARAIAEVTRIAAEAARLLVIVQTNHPATSSEPHQLGWDVLRRFDGGWRVVTERQLEMQSELIHLEAERGIEYDHSRPGRRGVLVAELVRTGGG